MERKSQEEIIASPAYKMLESMIQDRVDTLRGLQKSIEFTIKRAKKPSYITQEYPKKENGRRDFDAKPSNVEVFYKPTFRTGVSFDNDKNGNEREITLKYQTRELKHLTDLIAEVVKIEGEIGDLNREKLYLVAPDYDWQDQDRRYNRVFGK